LGAGHAAIDPNPTVQHHTIKRLARALETATVATALLALGFRATLYWRWPPPPGASYGSGDLVDFGLGLVVFALATLAASCAVALSLRADRAGMAAAYRPLVVGTTTFAVYYFLHPYVPRLL